MKRFLLTVVLAAAPLALAAQTLPPQMLQLPPMPETVSVGGTGRVSLTPDRFSFSVGVQTVGATVDEAVNENNTRGAAVVAALKKAGATAAEVRTSNFSIFPQQDYTQGKLPRILGYQVTNNVSVTRSQVGDAGRLLQVAINAGVNTASSLNFEVSDPRRGRDEGLRAAFDDARGKAALLAQAAGRTLGRALSVSEGTTPTPYPQPMMGRVMAAKSESMVADIPVEGGTQETTFNVSVVFELR
jgi:uncharacterized protein YggE